MSFKYQGSAAGLVSAGQVTKAILVGLGWVG